MRDGYITAELTINGLPVRAEYTESSVKSIFQPLLADLRRKVADLRAEGAARPLIVFLAAPPGAGKSTLACFLEQLAEQAEGGKAAEIGTGDQTASGASASVDNGGEKCSFQTLGLDGFHHTAAYLKSTKGMYSWECAPHEVLLQSVKGAPESYDTALFAEKLRAVRNADGTPVFWPVYDRQLHDVVPDRIPVTGDILLIEGNWLLLSGSPWKEIAEEYADYTIFIRAEEEQLRDRLIHRKVMGGKTEAEGRAWYDAVDGPNVRRVLQCSAPADLTLRMVSDGDYRQQKQQEETMKQQNTIRMELDRDWHFHRGAAKRWKRLDHDTVYAMTKAGQEVGDMEIFLHENDWTDVSVPHDWSTMEASDPDEMPDNGFKPRGEGWYYTKVQLPAYEDDACVTLTFEGIMGESVIYVNGVLAERNPSGYTAFNFEISDYVLPGEAAEIVVHADNTNWEGWWYEGAGIYRPVYLTIAPAVHVTEGGVFAKPVCKGAPDGAWTLEMSAELENTSGEDEKVCVVFSLQKDEGAVDESTFVTVPKYGTATAKAQITVRQPKLWSPDDPQLYRLETSVVGDAAEEAAEPLQKICTPVGFRKIEWTDHGMFINGEKTPVRGICCHQDHAGVGIAITRSLLRYRIGKLRAMGCNALRCAHNCPSEDLLAVCDEMGMLVMAENRHYRSSDEVMQQLDALTKTSRNHPSVFLYSLFNEEPWQAETRGRRMAEKMLRRIREKDDSRPITAAMNGGVLTKENASDVLDVAGMNYFIEDYNTYAKRRPGHPMVGTENGPLYATRGIYRDDEKEQVYNSYGLTTAFFGNTLQDTMEALEGAPQVAGVFVWGGFDYRGEPQPFEWPSVFSHWGLTDNCGFEKDTFYMLRSYYSDGDEPMLHLLPHWNHAAGETVRVCAMTNCDSVQLFVNDKPYEEKKVVRRRTEWEVPFEAGEIRAVAVKYIEGKKAEGIRPVLPPALSLHDEHITAECEEMEGGTQVTLSSVVTTAGEAAAVAVTDAAPAEGYDSSILNICLVDAAGRPVPGRKADRPVLFDVQAGTLVGVGNGDPNGTQPDLAETVPTFCGKCQAIVLPDREGKVRVTVKAKGLPEAVFSRG